MQRYGTFWPRFWASFIDGLVLAPLGVIDSYLAQAKEASALFLFLTVVSFSSCWLYTVILHAKFGQTVGKMAMGIKVLDLSEKRCPGWGQAFLRDIGMIIINTLGLIYLLRGVLTGEYFANPDADSWFVLILSWAAFGWWITELLTMLFSEKRRALHDYIAGTVVVRLGVPAKIPSPPPIQD